MTWTFLYLMLFLKIPIIALLGLVWWAIKQEPDPYEQPADDDGGVKRDPHPRRPFPRTPRRGPHGEPPPTSPARVRVTVARSRLLER